MGRDPASKLVGSSIPSFFFFFPFRMAAQHSSLFLIEDSDCENASVFFNVSSKSCAKLLKCSSSQFQVRPFHSVSFSIFRINAFNVSFFLTVYIHLFKSSSREI